MSLIKVTEEIIHVSKHHSCELCPVALAIRAALPHRHVVVYGDGTALIEGTSYILPDVALDVIEAWDNYQEVKPVEFYDYEMKELGEEEEDG